MQRYLSYQKKKRINRCHRFQTVKFHIDDRPAGTHMEMFLWVC